MPYYRITIFLKNKKPVQGLRYYDNVNMDNVTLIARAKAREHFQDIVDVEVANVIKSLYCRKVVSGK